jgi:hypothetical protein
MVASTLRASIGALVVLQACGDTGREHFIIPAQFQGTPARAVTIEGATLELTRAEVAFGPLYLCATESAESELCETALAELLSVRTFDALSPALRELGELDATTGSVRSGFFDYGISWLLTRQEPAAHPSAAAGHSARLRLRVTAGDGSTLSVSADVDLEPLSPGDAAVNGLQTRRDLRGDDRLVVTVDPSAWLERIRYERLLELDTDADGDVELAPGDQPYEAIVQGMTVHDPARLIWK